MLVSVLVDGICSIVFDFNRFMLLLMKVLGLLWNRLMSIWFSEMLLIWVWDVILDNELFG